MSYTVNLAALRTFLNTETEPVNAYDQRVYRAKLRNIARRAGLHIAGEPPVRTMPYGLTTARARSVAHWLNVQAVPCSASPGKHWTALSVRDAARGHTDKTVADLWPGCPY